MVRWSLGASLVRENVGPQKVYKKRARARFDGLLRRRIAAQKRLEKRPGTSERVRRGHDLHFEYRIALWRCLDRKLRPIVCRPSLRPSRFLLLPATLACSLPVRTLWATPGTPGAHTLVVVPVVCAAMALAASAHALVAVPPSLLACW